MAAKDLGKCVWVLDRIDSYIDGDLTGEELGRFEEHVEECGSCSREMVLAQEIVDELHSLPEHVCPRRVMEEAAGRIEEPSSAPRLGRLRDWFGGRAFLAPRPVLAAMLIVVVVAVVFVLSRNEQSPLGDAPRPEAISQTQYTEEDLEQAKQDVMLALAYVGKFGRKTSHIVRDDVISERVVTPVLKAVVTATDATTKQQ